MLFRMYGIIKDFLCILLYITVHVFDLSHEQYTIQLKLDEQVQKNFFKTFEKSKFRPTAKLRIKDLIIFWSQ